MRCISGAQFNMRASVLKPIGAPEVNGTQDTDTEGHWTYIQDPTSGALIRTWVTDVADNPTTPANEAVIYDSKFDNVPCSIRGVIDGGIRVAGTTERFSETYENVDWVKATFPPSVNVTKRDRVTNIRNRKGEVVWKEEESTNKPTVFNVMGVTPVLDHLGRVLYNTALLERAEVQ